MDRAGSVLTKRIAEDLLRVALIRSGDSVTIINERSCLQQILMLTGQAGWNRVYDGPGTAVCMGLFFARWTVNTAVTIQMIIVM